MSVASVLKKMGVSKAGYYNYIKRKTCPQKQRKKRVCDEIQKIHEESHKIYGAPKITQVLKQKGEVISERTVGKYMREIGIKAHYIKPYTITTIGQDFSSQLQNLLNRKFNPTKPNAAWCTDITYIWTYMDGFVYLTSIMDLYSRKIISWTLTKTMEAEAVLRCLEEAKEQRPTEIPTVIQSDRGIQYVSMIYQKLTNDMICSYSHKGTPWDNACIEAFHALIKREWLNQYRIVDYHHAHRLVFEYIETFYNTVRIHSHCGYVSPQKYETNWHLNQISQI